MITSISNHFRIVTHAAEWFFLIYSAEHIATEIHFISSIIFIFCTWRYVSGEYLHIFENSEQKQWKYVYQLQAEAVPVSLCQFRVGFGPKNEKFVAE